MSNRVFVHQVQKAVDRDVTLVGFIEEVYPTFCVPCIVLKLYIRQNSLVSVLKNPIPRFRSAPESNHL